MKTESVELNNIEMYYATEGTREPLLLLYGGVTLSGCGFGKNWKNIKKLELLKLELLNNDLAS